MESLFFKKRVQRDDDRIWMTTAWMLQYQKCPVQSSKLFKKKARGNNKVDSMEEWFQYNLNRG